jgi:hypothetical protein
MSLSILITSSVTIKQLFGSVGIRQEAEDQVVGAFSRPAPFNYGRERW